MGGPEPGKYFIQLDAHHKPLIGVDFGPWPVKPVITEGNERVWNVERLPDGKYKLSLETAGGPLFIQDEDGKLVGSDMPPPFVWEIRGPEGGPYTIEVPSGIIPTRGWTVLNPQPHPKSPVTINFIEVPLSNHKWIFIRWPGPE